MDERTSLPEPLARRRIPWQRAELVDRAASIFNADYRKAYLLHSLNEMGNEVASIWPEAS